eukprot:607150-Rhodomonas_salina.2
MGQYKSTLTWVRTNSTQTWDSKNGTQTWDSTNGPAVPSRLSLWPDLHRARSGEQWEHNCRICTAPWLICTSPCQGSWPDLRRVSSRSSRARGPTSPTCPPLSGPRRDGR